MLIELLSWSWTDHTWTYLDFSSKTGGRSEPGEGLATVPVVLCSRVTWGKAPPFGDDLSLTYLFASTSEKSYMYVTNYMLCV